MSPRYANASGLFSVKNMGILYKSKRIGKGGRVFEMLKFRTLKDGSGAHEFAAQGIYTKYGRFLRKYKLDELPQLINVLRGDMNVFGYRPEEPRTFQWLPKETQETFLKYKPGIIDLASLHFIDEERLLELSGDPQETFWGKIKPIKIALQMFYLEHKSWLLNVSIRYGFFKKIIKK